MKYTLQYLENSILIAFLGQQDIDSDGGLLTPLTVTYRLIKDAAYLPEGAISDYTPEDLAKWHATLAAYTTIRKLGYGHFEAIQKIKDISNVLY